MHELISLWMSWVQDWGYAGVIVLMAMESSIFPVPSEVVIPPAAILSAQEGASMSFWGVVAVSYTHLDVYKRQTCSCAS